MRRSLIDNEDLGYGTKIVLPQLSFGFMPGERIVLLGRSGSGKTTLINAIYQRLAVLGCTTALVPQDQALVPQLSVFHNVYMGRLDRHGGFYNLVNLICPCRAARDLISPILDTVGLSDFARKPVEALSGGQKQRVALARAMFRGGDILIGDEPVSSVDETQAQRLLDHLQGIFATAIVALHDTALARRFSTRVVGIREGKVVINAPTVSVSDAALGQLYSH